MTDFWATKGIKPFIYINPYFANTTNLDPNKTTESQFDVGYKNGYFIKNLDGTPKL